MSNPSVNRSSRRAGELPPCRPGGPDRAPAGRGSLRHEVPRRGRLVRGPSQAPAGNKPRLRRGPAGAEESSPLMRSDSATASRLHARLLIACSPAMSPSVSGRCRPNLPPVHSGTSRKVISHRAPNSSNLAQPQSGIDVAAADGEHPLEGAAQGAPGRQRMPRRKVEEHCDVSFRSREILNP